MNLLLVDLGYALNSDPGCSWACVSVGESDVRRKVQPGLPHHLRYPERTAGFGRPESPERELAAPWWRWRGMSLQ